MLVVCMAAAAVSPAAAQEQSGSAEVVVEVDEDGRILIDGQPVAGSEERVVIRLRDSDRIIEDGRRGPPARVSASLFRGGGAGFEPPRPPRIRRIEPIVERLRMEFDGIETLVDEHLEVADLERTSREQAAQARRADGERRNELESQLRETLEEIFEAKMELRRARLAQIEERQQEHRTELEERSAAREDIIGRRFQELLGETDVLEW
jgi:hypothetical protein